MTDIVTILRAARTKIERPECWASGGWTRDAMGWPVRPSSDKAVSWCACGALIAVAGREGSHDTAAYDAMRAIVGDSIIDWNDAKSTTHAMVLDAFDRAITAAERTT